MKKHARIHPPTHTKEPTHTHVCTYTHMSTQTSIHTHQDPQSHPHYQFTNINNLCYLYKYLKNFDTQVR